MYNRMRWHVMFQNDSFGFLTFDEISPFWSYLSFLCLNLILCPLCNSNTLQIILILLGRNVEQDETTYCIQDWQLWLSYFWTYLSFLCLNLISCPLCNSNTLYNILMILGRNVEQDEKMCCLQEWQLGLGWGTYIFFFSKKKFYFFLIPPNKKCESILLPPYKKTRLFCFHHTKNVRVIFLLPPNKNCGISLLLPNKKNILFFSTSSKQKMWNYSASTIQKCEIILLPLNKNFEIILPPSKENMKLLCFHQTKIWHSVASNTFWYK